jgi:16S rRNA (adenine1518-N6/adenine1519-N6)-dimethyltransferase
VMPLACDRKLLSQLTQAAFGQRRKMLRQSLKSLSGGNAEALLDEANINPELRSEEIEIEEFIALARALKNFRRELV